MEDIVLQSTWGWEIAVYLFLGGLAAGTVCAVAVINLFSGGRFKNTIRFGAWAGVITLAVGISALLIEVGLPFRAIILYESFVNFNSWMAVGAWFLLVGLFLYVLYALSSTGWVTSKIRFLARWQTALSIIAVPVSLSIAAYTGVLLGVLWTHPLWNTWFLPALFTVSALDTGVALVTAYAVLRESGEKVDFLKKSLEISAVLLIALEGTILAFYFTKMLSVSEVAATSVQVLTSGELSLLFWILVVGFGLAVPFLVALTLIMRSGLGTRTRAILPILGIISCLAGGFTLRLVMLSAGLPAFT